MKIYFYHKYSDLDNRHEFGVVPEYNENTYFAWVFFHLGQELQKIGLEVYLFPYKVYSWEKPVAIYKINGADKVAKLIANRIKKILVTIK
jgi:hypothetical protein